MSTCHEKIEQEVIFFTPVDVTILGVYMGLDRVPLSYSFLKCNPKHINTLPGIKAKY